MWLREESINYLRCVCDCGLCIRRREQHPNGKQISDEISGEWILVLCQSEGHAQIAFDPKITHACRFAVLDLNKSVAFKALQGFTQGRAGDADQLGKVSFSG